jgi:hypothetical protein
MAAAGEKPMAVDSARVVAAREACSEPRDPRVAWSRPDPAIERAEALGRVVVCALVRVGVSRLHRLVMDEAAEALLAVLGIVAREENEAVPRAVDASRGRDGRLGLSVDVKEFELSTNRRSAVRVRMRSSRAMRRITWA